MSKRSRNVARLAVGDYEPQGHWLSCYGASARFLAVVCARHPIVLEELTRLQWTSREAGRFSEKDRVAVRDWAQKHGLISSTDYFELAAMQTLETWARDADARARRQLSMLIPDVIAKASSREPIFPNPLNETADEWLQRAKSLWLARVIELEQDDSILGLAGPVVAAKGKSNTQHFDWLADHVVGKQSAAEIARRAGAEAPAVRKAIRGLAELVLLTPLRTKLLG